MAIGSSAANGSGRAGVPSWARALYSGGTRDAEATALNYSHHFHAGNFADLLKHAILLALLERMTAEPSPLMVLDTHAGAGSYDLEGEAAAGVARLMADDDAPPAFASLKAAVTAANSGGPLRHYPGSPALVLPMLRPGDRFEACELRADDHAVLADLIAKGRPAGVKAEALRTDGFSRVAKVAIRAEPRALVLIDPPFERADDYKRSLTAAKTLVQGRPGWALAVWTPLKDLETFDRFLRGLESLNPPDGGLVVQARLRTLDNPMRMNGCAMSILGGPDITAPARAAAEWIVGRIGEAGGAARVEPLVF